MGGIPPYPTRAHPKPIPPHTRPDPACLAAIPNHIQPVTLVCGTNHTIPDKYGPGHTNPNHVRYRHTVPNHDRSVLTPVTRAKLGGAQTVSDPFHSHAQSQFPCPVLTAVTTDKFVARNKAQYTFHIHGHVQSTPIQAHPEHTVAYRDGSCTDRNARHHGKALYSGKFRGISIHQVPEPRVMDRNTRPLPNLIIVLSVSFPYPYIPLPISLPVPLPLLLFLSLYTVFTPFQTSFPLFTVLSRLFVLPHRTIFISYFSP